jgi:hypothetical protein
MVCSKPVWTDAKRTREDFEYEILEYGYLKSLCEWAKKILNNRREDYECRQAVFGKHGNTEERGTKYFSGSQFIKTRGMSQKNFESFAMRFFQEEMECEFILRFVDGHKKTNYHGYAKEYTFKMSYRNDGEDDLAHFELGIDCNSTEEETGKFIKNTKQRMFEWQVLKDNGNLSELPVDLADVLKLFREPKKHYPLETAQG